MKWVVVSVTAAVVLITGAARGQGVDPAVLVAPTASPAFRELVKGAEWDKRFKAALAAAGGVDGLVKSAAPDAGHRICTIEDASAGRAAGLAAGDVLTTIDGKPIGYNLRVQMSNTRDQTVTVVTGKDKPRDVVIPGGLHGLRSVPLFRPELVYVRKGPRNDKWDAYVVVGCATCRSDPDLAETAWFHATAAGYAADFFSDLCGLHLAWRQGRMAEAVAHAAMLDTRKDAYPGLNKWAYVRQLAIADGKLAQALAGRMVADPGPRDFAGPIGDAVEALAKVHADLPDDLRTQPSPLHFADTDATGRLPLLADMEAIPHRDPGWFDYRKKVTEHLARHRGQMKFFSGSGMYVIHAQRPKNDAPDVELAVRAKVRETDKLNLTWDKVFIAALVNCDRDETAHVGPGRPGMLGVTIEPFGYVNIVQGSPQPRLVQRLEIEEEVANKREFTIRLLHVGARDEVWIDNRRLASLPSADRPKRVGFHLGGVGTTTDVKVEFSQLKFN